MAVKLIETRFGKGLRLRDASEAFRRKCYQVYREYCGIQSLDHQGRAYSYKRFCKELADNVFNAKGELIEW